jgi:outer membrane immunogenic protein
LTARIGYLVQPQSLLYLKGGVAWAHNKFVDNATSLVGPTTSTGKSTRGGWTAGGGIEQMFVPHWSLFVEYDYTNFGRRTENLTGGPTEAFSIKQNLQTVLVGVNYRFGSR